MKNLVFKNWLIITVKGILTVIFGIAAILLSDVAVVYAIGAFGAILIGSGALMIGLTLIRAKDNDRNCLLLEGSIDMLLGFLILANPMSSSTVFLTFIMIWISVMGLLQIYNGYRIRSLLNHWWVLSLNGLLAVIFAILIFTQSFQGLTLAFLIGLQAIVFGSFLIITSIKLKQILDEIKIEIPAKQGEEGNQELSFY